MAFKTNKRPHGLARRGCETSSNHRERFTVVENIFYFLCIQFKFLSLNPDIFFFKVKLRHTYSNTEINCLLLLRYNKKTFFCSSYTLDVLQRTSPCNDIQFWCLAQCDTSQIGTQVFQKFLDTFACFWQRLQSKIKRRTDKRKRKKHCSPQHCARMSSSMSSQAWSAHPQGGIGNSSPGASTSLTFPRVPSDIVAHILPPPSRRESLRPLESSERPQDAVIVRTKADSLG